MKNPNDNEQTQLLRNIWQQIKVLDKNLGSRIDQTNERLDQTNEHLDALQTEVRTGFHTLDGHINTILLGEHGREQAALRDRVKHIEEHLGLRSG